MSGPVIFHDAQRQRDFDREGFVCFPLLSCDEASALCPVGKDFTAHISSGADRFTSIGRTEDDAVIRQADEAIREFISPVLPEHFRDFTLLGYNFLFKQPGEDSIVPNHQDWTYVDETRFNSMNVWVALQDTDIGNGCMWVVPRSHRLPRYLRPAPDYPWPMSKAAGVLNRFRTAVALKAGECICFNNRTVHGSFPNLTEVTRIAAVGTVYPSEAQLLHHFQRPDGQTGELWEFELEGADFLNMRKGMPPPRYAARREVRTELRPMGPVEVAARLLWLSLKDGLTGNARQAQ